MAGKSSQSNGYELGHGLDEVVNGGAALSTEVKANGPAFVTLALVLLAHSLDRGVTPLIARLGTKYASCTALAFPTMTNRYADRLPASGYPQLPTATPCNPIGHPVQDRTALLGRQGAANSPSNGRDPPHPQGDREPRLLSAPRVRARRGRRGATAQFGSPSHRDHCSAKVRAKPPFRVSGYSMVCSISPFANVPFSNEWSKTTVPTNLFGSD